MAEIPRLNGIIRALMNGGTAMASFASPDIESALVFGAAKYDGIVFEMEHNPWDPRLLRDCLQYMLNRRQIVERGNLTPAVTPIVRIPPNGGELSQFMAKQALDIGVYGIVWPHVSTAEQAYNAVASCRYPRQKTAKNYEPVGVRGDGPHGAVRYWGLSQQDYYARADVWPLDPNGEILVVLMIEDVEGIANLDDMLKRVPGIGLVLIGEGDLSQELGYPRQYDHPVVREAMGEILRICKAHNVPVGHPHVGSDNIERVIEEGYRFLMASPVRSFAPLDKGLKLIGR